MNVFTRGARAAFRNPVRSGAMVIILAACLGLLLAMLVAYVSITAKINEVKASTATQISINPAGAMGGMGGGDFLTNEQVAKVASTPHIISLTASLRDQLGSNETSLTPSFELGNLGKRQMRFESRADPPSSSQPAIQEFKPRTTVTGTTNPGDITSKGSLEGEAFDGKSSDLAALVGKHLAAKNNLSVGSTFTAYGQTITVKGIYTTDNDFEDNGLIMPLKTLQTLSNQTDAVSTVEAVVDSSDNVASTVTALKDNLGDKADITSQQEQAENSIAPLKNIASLALTGVIGAAVTGMVIILLVMVIAVRERRKEIGVIKAIGGTNKKVIGQFIIEALTLVGISTILGLLLGIFVSGPITQSLASSESSQKPTIQIGGAVHLDRQINTNIHAISSVISAQTFIISLGITVLIAIVGSAVPAWLIARVRPSETLRSE